MEELERTFIQGLYYTEKEIAEAKSKNLLLNLDLDMSNTCNLNCVYCDKTHIGETHSKKEGELSLKETIDIINQAKELGCKNLQIIGAGEPMLDPNFWEIIKHASDLDIISVIYTNGTLITEESVKKLHDLKTSIVLKFNSFDPKIQNKMVGNQSYDKKTRRALFLLQKEGFNKSTPTRLAIDCVATKLNKDHVLEVFSFCRENNISPQISGLIPHGEALERNLVLKKDDYKEIFDKSVDIDKNKGLNYEYQLPFMGGFQCKQIKYGLYIDIQGNAWECNAGELKLGNIREKKLKEMWLSREALEFRSKWTCGKCHIREKYWKIQDGKR